VDSRFFYDPLKWGCRAFQVAEILSPFSFGSKSDSHTSLSAPVPGPRTQKKKDKEKRKKELIYIQSI
jgi:hypothetical protein